MAEIVMPRLSDTMEEGTILSWLVADGETVSRGQELVEIETDKANMTYESDQEGVLRTLAAEGDTLPVGAPIARVGEDEPGVPGTTTAQRTTENDDEPSPRPADVRAVGENTDGNPSPVVPAAPGWGGAGRGMARAPEPPNRPPQDRPPEWPPRRGRRRSSSSAAPSRQSRGGWPRRRRRSRSSRSRRRSTWRREPR